MKEEMKRLNYKIGSLICADSRAQNSYVNVIVLPYRVLDMKDVKKEHISFHEQTIDSRWNAHKVT